MPSSQSTVSVVIPVYNRGARLRATIDSVLTQTIFDCCEIILVNDGSTDETRQILEYSYGQHSQIKIIHQSNSGVAEARNRGLKEACGEYVAFLDHDDIWLPEKLELQLEAFRGRPKTGVVYCCWIEVNETGVLVADDQQLIRSSHWQPKTGRVFNDLIPRNLIVSMSVPLIRTRLVREIGGFDPKTAPSDDWDLWLRLARCCEFGYVPCELVIYVRHGSQQSNDSIIMWRSMQRVLVKHWPRVLNQPRKLWLIVSFSYFLKTADFYLKAKTSLLDGNFVQTHDLLKRAMLRFPLIFLTPQWLYLSRRLLTKNIDIF
jgi:glycosyltransferase involved in cell wall biosynthesis